MGAGIDFLRHSPAIFLRSQPVTGIVFSDFERFGNAAQGFVLFLHVFMEIAHGEFARTCIDWIAPAQPDGIAFGNGAPVLVLLEKGQNMVIIARGLEIHEQCRLAMEHQSCRRDKRRFNAVAGIIPQGHAGGLAGVALRFEIDRDFGEKILNLFRRVQLAEDRSFVKRQADGAGKGSVKGHELESGTVDLFHSIVR